MPTRSGRRFASIAVAMLICTGLGLASPSARADACPAPEGAPAVARIDSQARKEFLAHAFEREVEDIDAWSWTWGSVYSAGAITQGVALTQTVNPGNRTDLTVGVISTAFGASSLTLLPLQLTVPLRSARRHINDPDTCASLARAERTLVSVEKDQALANGILAHIGNVAVNAGIALILGLGYDRWKSAAISGGVGVAIGEANAFTQPHHLREVLERYRSGHLDVPPLPESSIAWSIVPVATPQMSGAAIVGAW